MNDVGFGFAGERYVVEAEGAVVGLLEHLDGFAPSRGAPPLSVPKRIAALALYVRWARGYDAEMALQAAMACLSDRLNCTRTAFKKASSEARAILQFGLDDFSLPRTADAELVLREITAALQPVNTREVTQTRAMAYRGVRGGRRATPRPRPAHAAIANLIEQAQAGDSEARAELAELETLIRSAAIARHAGDRPEAIR